MSNRGPGLGEELDLTFVEPDAMRDDCLRTEDPALVELLDGASTELLEALLNFPDRLGAVGVDAGVELFGEGRSVAKHLR